MKSLLVFTSFLLLSSEAFSQRRPIDLDIDINVGSLPLCIKRLENARERVRDLQSRLQSCELRGTDSRELDFLRSENARLNSEVDRMRSDNLRVMDENRELRRQIDDLLGRNRVDSFICSASCTDRFGSVDLRYLALGTGFFEAEADVNAKREVQSQYSCNFGVKLVKCEQVTSEVPRNYCVAACTDRFGSLDERYSIGERGRNLVEAETLALKAAQKKFSCNFGVKIKTCN